MGLVQIILGIIKVLFVMIKIQKLHMISDKLDKTGNPHAVDHI